MDLEAEVLRRSALQRKEQDDAGVKPLFVAPAGFDLPKDGMLEYVTVATVYDFEKLEAGAVVMVGNEPEQHSILKCVVDNSVLFGVSLRLLTGIPESQSDFEFDQLVWSLEQVAYAPLVSELSLQKEARRQEQMSNESQHDKERRQFTRADGSVKPHSEFSAVSSSAEVDELPDDSELDGDA
jgi:hypothetical protein